MLAKSRPRPPRRPRPADLWPLGGMCRRSSEPAFKRHSNVVSQRVVEEVVSSASSSPQSNRAIHKHIILRCTAVRYEAPHKNIKYTGGGVQVKALKCVLHLIYELAKTPRVLGARTKNSPRNRALLFRHRATSLSFVRNVFRKRFIVNVCSGDARDRARPPESSGHCGSRHCGRHQSPLALCRQ